MTFTDNDLQRLKEDCERNVKASPARKYTWQADNVLALLARLEAAENFIIKDHPINSEPCSLCKAWRKACGK